MIFAPVAVLTMVAALAGGCAGGGMTKATAIFCPPDASAREVLAAREARRYVYLRTGTLLPIERSASLPADASGLVIARKDRPVVAAAGAALAGTARKLAPQHYLLKTLERDGRRVLFIVGGDDAGTLYAAYRFAEHLGVRFYSGRRHRARRAHPARNTAYRRDGRAALRPARHPALPRFPRRPRLVEHRRLQGHPRPACPSCG